MCASTDAQGRVRIDASGSGRVSPSGASASGQVNGQGNANAQGNASAQGGVQGSAAGQGNARGNVAGQGSAQGGANANANAQGSTNGNAGAQGNANGDAQGDADGYGNSSSEDTSGGSGGGSPRYQGYTGRFGVGVTGCPIVRIGIWSGFKAGGCVAVSFRFEALYFEMETQLLYGGTTHAFDWTFPMSFVIPLANDDSLFEGGYLRFGGSPVGATFAHKADGGSFVRFGLFAGAGYELLLSDYVSWRVIDARLSFDMGTRRAMDTHDHWVDLGLQLGTGIVL